MIKNTEYLNRKNKFIEESKELYDCNDLTNFANLTTQFISYVDLLVVDFEESKSLNFNDYQKIAKTTAIYPDEYKIIYPALGLVGEAGEVANKVKKIIRDGEDKMSPDWKQQLAYEIGDVLWYCAALASDLGIKLGDIASHNRDKLEARLTKGTLQGDGDNR